MSRTRVLFIGPRTWEHLQHKHGPLPDWYVLIHPFPGGPRDDYSARCAWLASEWHR